MARNSGAFVNAGVTRYQWPSNIPVVAAPSTIEERATVSPMAAATGAEPASGPSVAMIPASSSTDASNVGSQPRRAASWRRQVMTTWITMVITSRP